MVRLFVSGGQRGEPAHRRAFQGRLRPAAGAEDPLGPAARAAAGAEGLLGPAAGADHRLRPAAGLEDPVPASAGTGQLAGTLTGLTGLTGIFGRRPGRLARASTRPAVPRALMTHNDERSVRLISEGVALASQG
jgi:hypothetical protein